MKNEKIERHNQICDMASRLLDFQIKKVKNLYNHLCPLIGYRATILLLCLEQKSSVSTEEIKFIGAVLESLSDKGSFDVPVLLESSLTFTLTSKLKSYDTKLGYTYFISADPQSKWTRTSLNDSGKPYEIDLLLELYFFSDGEKITIAKAALEYDGPFHLQEKNVRSDKFRDSNIQASDIPVFRLPSQNTHFAPQQGREEFSARLDIYKSNVNHFIRKRIFDYECHILADRKTSFFKKSDFVRLKSSSKEGSL